MRVLTAAAWSIAVFMGVSESTLAAEYNVTPLGSEVRLRNNLGDHVTVTGKFERHSALDWEVHSTLSTYSGTTLLGQNTSPQMSLHLPVAFSDTDVVAGFRTFYELFEHGEQSHPEPVTYHAFVFANGAFLDLDALLAEKYATAEGAVIASFAEGVNNAGQVVGRYGSRAFLYDNGTITDLGSLGTRGAAANGISNVGQITGTSNVYYPSYGPERAFIYSNGSMREIGFLDWRTPSSQGQDINDAGQVIGTSSIYGQASYHGFLYEGGRMTDLGTLGGAATFPRDINNQGVVVGQSQFDSGDGYHAFVYRDGAMTDLNTLIDPSAIHAGLPLRNASSINDDGVIFAAASDLGTVYYYLLTPVAGASPDPANFNFEGGTQGWESNGEPIVTVSTSAEQHFAGAKSLSLNISSAGFASVRVLSPPASAGQSITFRVYLPADAHIDWIQPFAQEGEEGGWNWHGSWTPIEALQLGAWNSVTVHVPADAKELLSLGVEFYVSEASQGTVSVDSVDF